MQVPAQETCLSLSCLIVASSSMREISISGKARYGLRRISGFSLRSPPSFSVGSSLSTTLHTRTEVGIGRLSQILQIVVFLREDRCTQITSGTTLY